jgi:hypothetical protein
MRFSIKIVLPVFVFSLIPPLIASADSAPEPFGPLMKKDTPTVVNFSTKQVVKIHQQSPLYVQKKLPFKRIPRGESCFVKRELR